MRSPLTRHMVVCLCLAGVIVLLLLGMALANWWMAPYLPAGPDWTPPPGVKPAVPF